MSREIDVRESRVSALRRHDSVLLSSSPRFTSVGAIDSDGIASPDILLVDVGDLDWRRVRQKQCRGQFRR